MCHQCESETDNKAPSIKARHKLWKMPRHYHCPIIGTCLTMSELHKIQRNCTLPLPSRPRDHQLHTVIVGQAEHNGAVAHRIQKLLDRKYQRWIKAYGQLTSLSDQQQFWADALKRGEISGPFWALLSQRSSCPQLVDQALGDVHMLSHLQGASNRADLKRSNALEQQVAELEQRLEQQRQQFALKIAKQAAQLAEQKQSLAALQSRLMPVAKTEPRQLVASRKQCRLLTDKQDWLVNQLAQREQRLTELEHGHCGLIEQLQEAQQERESLERALNQLLIRFSPTAEPGNEEQIDLNGKRLAYIGGRPTLYPQLKRYVETLNGQLTLHDGGQEDSRAGLCNSLSSADLVFCPIDCVSHDACLRVKRFCKQHQKPFVPLRSASLSAFSNGLHRASQEVTADAISAPMTPLDVTPGSN